MGNFGPSFINAVDGGIVAVPVAGSTIDIHPTWSAMNAAVFEAAIAMASVDNELTLYFPPGFYPLGVSGSASPLVVSEHITLKFCPGAVLQLAAGVTLRVDGVVDAGLHRIFDTTTNASTSPHPLVILTSRKLSAVYPEWWGVYRVVPLRGHSALKIC